VIPAFTLGEKGVWSVEAIKQVTHTKALGQEMYSTYLLPFEIGGLILLVALIGGLALARRDEGATEANAADEATTPLPAQSDHKEAAQ
jgi:NADH-quinone oxidoreductase subunit J